MKDLRRVENRRKTNIQEKYFLNLLPPEVKVHMHTAVASGPIISNNSKYK